MSFEFDHGSQYLLADYKAVYPLLLIYAASSMTTQVPVFSYLLSYNSLPAVKDTPALQLQPQQLMMLMSSYVPFFLAPLGMMVDMALRLAKAQRRADGVISSRKGR